MTLEEALRGPDKRGVEPDATAMLAIRFIRMIKANFPEDSKGASVYYKRILLSDKENENRLEAMRMLGLTYIGLKKWSLAEEVFEKLMSCYFKAEEAFQEALGFWRQINAHGDQEALRAMNNMGHLYYLQKKYEESVKTYRGALEQYVKPDGPVKEIEIDVCTALGQAYEGRGNLANAHAMMLRAHVDYTKTLGSAHHSAIQDGISVERVSKLKKGGMGCRIFAGLDVLSGR